MMSSGSSGSSWRSSAKGNEAQYCETICNMLTMLSCSEQKVAHRALLAMTNSPESCDSLRRAGCIPLLIQILHPGSTTPIDSHPSTETKLRASKALKNIVHFNPDDKLKRKELRVLRLLEYIREFTSSTTNQCESTEKHPTSSLTALMKLSFDPEQRSTMCTLGAIHALADLILIDHKLHGTQPTDADCILTRHCSCVTLTNLTLVDVKFENEDIVQVSATVLRNLSLHADANSRDSLRDALAVNGLIKAALKVTKETALKATLCALCYLSAHSIQNKAAICSTPNALNFLLSLLRHHKSVQIVENAGGVLRNISSYIAGIEAYRLILRECHCFEILLEHLRSANNVTIVSNACGILCHLSGNEEMLQIWTKESPILSNAVPVLKSLEYSKNERISQGASAALLNLRTFCNQQTKESRQCDAYDDEQPLDLTTNCKSTSPVRKLNPPPFLNPPIYNGSVSSTRSCPDIQHSDIQVKRPKIEASTDETFNYSHYDEEEDEEEEKNQQKDTVKTYCDEGTPGFSGSMVDLSMDLSNTSFTTFDTFMQFQVEDTPAIFSRTSSLSSIEENQVGENGADKDMLDGKKPLPPNVQLSSTAVPTVVVPKRVMFSAEETPLMFSRCSSVGSLESCGDLNNGPCESDCVSEFSRRTSEAVSPSEIPDSPPRGPNPVVISTVQQPDETDFIQVESKNKPSTTNDELKVFAMEGTPFLISTATSLSDIVGELDTMTTMTSQVTLHQGIIPEEPLPLTVSPVKVVQPLVEPDPDDPIYSDIQLLQKCIKAGRAVGLAKKHVVEDDEVDLSHLIQRGRARLLTRSEDNLKQYTNSSGPLSMTKSMTVAPIAICVHKPQSECSSNPESQSPVEKSMIKNRKTTPDRACSQSTTVDQLTAKVSNISISSTQHKSIPTGQNLSSDNSSPSRVNDLNIEKNDNNVSEMVVHTTKQKDNITNETSHPSDRRWTNDRPSFCSSSPSLSTTKAIKVVNRAEDTIDGEQSTVDSNSLISSHVDTRQKHVHQKQLLVHGGNSSQVSSFINIKKPSESVDSVNTKVSSSSATNTITSEIDGLVHPVTIMSSTVCNHSRAMRMPNPDITNFTPNPHALVPRSSSAQSKYDKYSVKRIESPKERRRNDSDRTPCNVQPVFSSIDKFDLKMKPAIPPKPARASDLRTGRDNSRENAREHSPTNSTTSLNTGAILKIPPKPPVRSTPPLNTTLPRNTKLMEGHGSSNGHGHGDVHHGHGSTKGNSAISLEVTKTIQHHLQQTPTPPIKLNFGGRIGNLFRKSFSKDSEKWGKKKDIWVKRKEKEKEKAVIPPVNQKPPQTNEDGLNGNCNTNNAIGTNGNVNVPVVPSVSKVMTTTTLTTTTNSNSNSSSGTSCSGQANGKSSTKTKITTV